ncbi:unnamed protein product [Ectocarpus sp. 6 AP-2014]
MSMHHGFTNTAGSQRARTWRKNVAIGRGRMRRVGRWMEDYDTLLPKTSGNQRGCA